MMDWAKANPVVATAILFVIAFLIWGGIILSVPLIANDWILKWSLFALLMAGLCGWGRRFILIATDPKTGLSEWA